VTPQEFVQKWAASTRGERAASQEHFIDLCSLLGEPTPNFDPTGETYAFEKGTTKTTGGEGFADVWKRGHFAWEYKGKHKDLQAAYRQLLQYRDPSVQVLVDPLEQRPELARVGVQALEQRGKLFRRDRPAHQAASLPRIDAPSSTPTLQSHHTRRSSTRRKISPLLSFCRHWFVVTVLVSSRQAC
jgi:hypothetical protein